MEATLLQPTYIPASIACPSALGFWKKRAGREGKRLSEAHTNQLGRVLHAARFFMLITR